VVAPMTESGMVWCVQRAAVRALDGSDLLGQRVEVELAQDEGRIRGWVEDGVSRCEGVFQGIGRGVYAIFRAARWSSCKVSVLAFPPQAFRLQGFRAEGVGFRMDAYSRGSLRPSESSLEYHARSEVVILSSHVSGSRCFVARK
jgi:hypothetical protein